jgi:hypothetical protein
MSTTPTPRAVRAAWLSTLAKDMPEIAAEISMKAVLNFPEMDYSDLPTLAAAAANQLFTMASTAHTQALPLFYEHRAGILDRIVELIGDGYTGFRAVELAMKERMH